MYCGQNTASEVFLIFTTQLYQYFSVFFLFALVSDVLEVFPPKKSQIAILHAAHFRRVVKIENYDLYLRFKTRFPKEDPKNTQMISMVKK